jgi:predicted enzyme involved in methoxymalonyl-ACP biosynthesis
MLNSKTDVHIVVIRWKVRTINSTIKIENRSEKISKKPKIGVCTLLSNLDNILKVLMYPLGAFSIMTSFLFDFPIELLYC